MQSKCKIYNEIIMPAVVNEWETEKIRKSLGNKVKQAKKSTRKTMLGLTLKI